MMQRIKTSKKSLLNLIDFDEYRQRSDEKHLIEHH
jgi:hypothetical protein